MSAKKLILDSSVIVKWVSSQDEEYLDQADQILRHAQTGKCELYTSELSRFEVANALLKGKGLELPQAKAALVTLYRLPIVFLSETEELAVDAYKLGYRLGITYYDAVFLSIAKKLRTALVTDNIKHQGKATEIKVIPLAEYSG